MKPPPFTITPTILNMSQAIARELGNISGRKMAHIPLKLRRSNNIQTIQASLAIEGNSLSLDQVTDIWEGRRVLGPPKDILEAKNALTLYKNLHALNPLSIKDLCKSHGILMQDLIGEAGRWRLRAVGILKGPEVHHIAPSAKRVPDLMEHLFSFLTQNKECSWLLKACIFHYELEFIHPFSDGNGRMGRLWQQLLLMKEDPVFEFLPVEVMIKEHQSRYYDALEHSDTLGESTPFIEFSLDIIHRALIRYAEITLPLLTDVSFRLEDARHHFKERLFSRQDYLLFHKNISTATASRDLLEGVERNLLTRQGEKNQTVYCFKKSHF